MQLKYAIVELVGEKASTENIECGLLRGLGEQDGDNFVWLITGKKIARGYNMAYYNILSVVIFDGITKTYTFFMADEDEQKEALKAVEEAYEGLKEIALTEGGTLLDVSKFKYVPDDFGKINSIPKHQEASSSSTGNASRDTGLKKPSNDWYGQNNQGIINNTYSREPEAHTWKRTTRKPTKKTLEKLRDKLALIAKREYEFKLLEIKGDAEAEKQQESMASGAADSDVSPYDGHNLPFCC